MARNVASNATLVHLKPDILAAVKEGNEMKNYNSYIEKYNEFSKILLRSVVEKEEKKNVVVSPVSVIVALFLAARATGGNTRERFFIWHISLLKTSSML